MSTEEKTYETAKAWVEDLQKEGKLSMKLPEIEKLTEKQKEPFPEIGNKIKEQLLEVDKINAGRVQVDNPQKSIQEAYNKIKTLTQEASVKIIPARIASTLQKGQNAVTSSLKYSASS